jgi:glycosyltransferase involved in cell wall biosynthesis
MAALDVLVLCSLEEPFGRVLIEAMALAKCVVAYGLNGPLEIISHQRDGLLVPPGEAPGEPEGMATAMRRLLRDPVLREGLATQARESVMQRFHIGDTAQRVLDLYHEVLA